MHREFFFMRAGCVLAALVVGVSSEAADVTYETRALTGTDGPLGPGQGPDVRFSSLRFPVLNAAGQTAFIAMLTGPDVTGTSGIYSEGSGSLAQVAREGQPAPGAGPDVVFGRFTSGPVLNAAGQTAFLATLAGQGVNDSNNAAIYSEGSGPLAQVVREGQQAPGAGLGVVFNRFISSPVFNNAGQTAFLATLTGPGVDTSNNIAIYSEGSGPLAQVARKGQEAPGTAYGVVFNNFSFAHALVEPAPNPVLNAAGQTAFFGLLAGPGVVFQNHEGIWSEGGGSGLALVARQDRPVPGTGLGLQFSSFGFPALNAAGQTAFRVTLAGPGVDFSNNEGIWFQGSRALVAREGQQTPGADLGVVFSAFNFADPVLNVAGQTAFLASLAGSGVDRWNDTGIYSEGSGSLAQVVREGQQAPGADVGVVFDDFSDAYGYFTFGLVPNLVLNAAGQTAFRGLLMGTGVTSWNNSGIWATDRDGQLHQIARTGDLLNVSNDPLNPDPRTIVSLTLTTGSGGEDGRGTSFNVAGQLAFSASFTDGSSGIFVATIASTFNLTLTRATVPATGYDLEWESQPGKVYDLVTSTDPATPIAQWPVHAAYGNIPATGTTTMLTAVPAAGPQRFFAVVEKDAD